VADTAAGDDHVVGAAHRDLAREERDHATASAFRSGAPLAWQIATARASAAWSGLGRLASESSVWTMRCTWSFAARPEPQTAPLICWGVWEAPGTSRWRAASSTTPRAWPTASAECALAPK